MNASIAIQVLPKVATSEETVRIVDEVIAFRAAARQVKGSALT